MPEMTTHKDTRIKQCIDLALEKANIAVKYDTSNDFGNAIAAYTEAVELLNFVLQSPTKEDDTEGLKSICNIYLERIDFLSCLKTSEDNSCIPAAAADTDAASSHQSKQSFNSVLMGIFAKKAAKKKKSTSAHYNIFNFTQKEMHKSMDVQPKSSKSSPILPLDHSKWSKQVRNKNHHISSDNLTSYQFNTRPMSYSPPRNQPSSLTHRFQQSAREGMEADFKRSSNHSDNGEDLNKPTISDNNDRRQKQFSSGGPFITNKQYNTSSILHGSNYCYPSISSAVEDTHTTMSLPIPKKSSQRRKRASPPMPLLSSSLHNHISQEPVRDSSLNASWRSRPFSPKSFSEPNKMYNMLKNETPSYPSIPHESSLPPPISDKSANRTSVASSVNKRVSSLRLKTTFSITNPPVIKSGGAITPTKSSSSTEGDDAQSPSCSSVPGSPIRTVKIDPSIILSYPEAQVTVANESIINSFNSISNKIVESAVI